MLESYITPLLMSYVDKYIKNLKPSDLSLSLWGGDVVLYNLELRLDVLEKELKLPITFLSGKIHKLQIHIPWTKLGSEPVEITINTLECIVQLRYPDHCPDDHGSTKQESDLSGSNELKNEDIDQVQESNEGPPSGYAQNLINRVINNVSINLQNVILKYLEEDIVLSVNIKSAETFSVNSNWEKAFIDVAAPEFLLRKVCNISDLTVCLDKRTSSGEIDLYQDPLLYKCGLSCRMLMRLDNLLRPLETKLNVYCESADISLTDQQLPMFIRLVTLCVGLYFGNLDLPGCNYRPHPAEKIVEQQGTSASRLNLLEQVTDPSITTMHHPKQDNDNGAWMDWMWSLVPTLAEDQSNKPSGSPPPVPLMSFGLYVSQVTVTIKLTGKVSEGNFFGGQRFEFKPVLSFELSGVAVEAVMKGDEFFYGEVGLSYIAGWNIGDCVCGGDESLTKDDIVSVEEKEDMFLSIRGPEMDLVDSSGFLRGSLFDNTELSSLEIPELTFNAEEFLKAHNKTLALRRYGALFLDILYTMEIEPEKTSDSTSKDQVDGVEVITDIRLVKEFSFRRIIVGPTHLQMSSSMVHKMELIFKLSFEDLVARKEKSEPFYDEFIEKQLLAGNFPTQSLTVTVVSLTVTLLAADHGKLLPGPVVQSSSSTELHTVSSQLSLQSIQGQEEISPNAGATPACILQIDRVDIQCNQAMYPSELTKLTISNAEYPAGKTLLMYAYTDAAAQVFGIQVNLSHVHSDLRDVPQQNLIPPFSAAGSSRTCIMPASWGGSNLVKNEIHFEVPTWQFYATKPQFELALHILKSWNNNSEKPSAISKQLLHSVFSFDQEALTNQPELHFRVSNIELEFCETVNVLGASGSVGAISASVKSTNYSGSNNLTPLLEGPADTSELYTRNLFTSTELQENIMEKTGPVLSFTLQLPQPMFKSGEPVTQPGPPLPAADHVTGLVLFHLRGVTVSLDPLFYKWVSYRSPSPTLSSRHKAQPERTKSTRHQSLTRTSSATTPRKKSFARGFGSVASQAGAKEGKLATGKQENQRKQFSPNNSAQGTVDGRKAFESWLYDKLPFITSTELQIDLKSVVVFMPEKHINHSVKSSGIVLNYSVQSLKTTNSTFPATLVICLPSFQLHSANHEPMSVRQSLPVKIRHREITRRETLPWTLQVENLAVYSVHAKTGGNNLPVARYLLSTVSSTAVLASARTSSGPGSPHLAPSQLFKSGSVGSRRVSTLGFCVHTDFRPIEMSCSRKQLLLLANLLENLLTSLSRETSTTSADVAFAVQASASRTTALDPKQTKPLSSSSGQDQVESESLPSETVSSAVFSQIQQPVNSIRISLWLQWTLPRVIMNLYSRSRVDSSAVCVSAELEDLTASVDYMETMLHMQFKVGAFNVTHFSHNSDGYWMHGPFNGILFSCNDIISSKPLRTTSARRSSIGRCEISGNRPHGFLTVTYKRASLHLKRRRSSADKPAKDEDCFKDQHEIRVNIQSFDVVLWTPAVVATLDTFDFSLLGKFQFSTPKAGGSEKTREGLPKDQEKDKTCAVTVNLLPLLFVDMRNVRLFIPSESAGKEIDRTESANYHEDMAVIQLSIVRASPHPDNPNSRTVLNQEFYEKFRKFGRSSRQALGYDIHDVQYQIDLCGFGVWSGSWGQLCGSAKHDEGLERAGILVDQNPALEWNTQMWRGTEEVLVTPVISGTDFRVVLAPAISVDRQCTVNGGTFSAESVLVCGWSLEFNVVTDVDCFLNKNQVQLLQTLSSENTKALSKVSLGISPETDKEFTMASVVPSSVDNIRENGDRIDSGFESMGTKAAGNIVPQKRDLSDFHPGKVDDNEESHSRFQSLGAPWEIFVSGRKLSVSVYHKIPRYDEPAGKEVHSTKANLPPRSKPGLIKPVLRVELVHPAVVVSTHTISPRIQMSCFDVNITGVSLAMGVVSKKLPDSLDYTVDWLKSGAGIPDQHSGILPSLVTVDLTNFLCGPADVSVDIGRSVHVSFNIENVRELSQFMDGLVLPGEGTSSEDNVGQIGPTSKTLCLSSFGLCTSDLFLQLEAPDIAGNPMLLCSVVGMEAKVCLKPDKQGNINRVDTGVQLHGAGVTTSVHNRSRPLVCPFTCSVDLEAVWAPHSRDLLVQSGCGFPQLYVFVEAACLQIMVGQEHVTCLKLLSDLAKQFTSLSAADEQPAKTATKKNDFTEDMASFETYDDIRAGPFRYVTASDESDTPHPEPWEIVFSSDFTDKPPTMTWKYPEPRALSAVELVPLPLSMPVLVNTLNMGDEYQVPCVLRYWDPTQKSFISYKDFHLSENTASSIPLPDPSSADPSEVIVAAEWQMVVDVTVDIEYPDDGSFDCDTTVLSYASPYRSLLSASSLAASVKVNSVVRPALNPALSAHINISILEVKFSNHLHAIGQAVPCFLAGFSMDPSLPKDQEFLQLTVEGLSGVVKDVGGEGGFLHVQTEWNCQAHVLDYGDLTYKSLLSPFDVGLTLALYHGDNRRQEERQEKIPTSPPVWLDVGLEAGSILAHVSQSTIHTIALSATAWGQDGFRDAERIILNHYIICNDTHEALRFGQVHNLVSLSKIGIRIDLRQLLIEAEAKILHFHGHELDTDESLLLGSRQTHAYSWRTPHTVKGSPRLHLCIETEGDWRWSEPFDIDSVGICSRTIHHRLHSATLFIEVKQLSGMQKQVLIRGSHIIVSRLSIDVDVQILTNPSIDAGQSSKARYQVLEDVSLPANTALPSSVISHGGLAGMRIRIPNGTTWSDMLPLEHLDGNQVQQVIVQLLGVKDFQTFYLWYNVEKPECYDQIRVTLSPLFVMRSHLPEPMLMKVSTAKTNSSSVLHLQGRAHEQQLYGLEPNSWHHLNFQFSGSADWSSPSVPLNSTLIELANMVTYDNSAEEEGIVGDSWPYCKNAQSYRRSDVALEEKPESSLVKNLSIAGHVVRDEKQPVASTVDAPLGMHRNSSPVPPIEVQCRVLKRWPHLSSLLVEIIPWCLLVNNTSSNLYLRDLERDITVHLSSGSVLAPHRFTGKVQFGTYFDDKSSSWSEAVLLPAVTRGNPKAAANGEDDGFSVPVAFVLGSGEIRGVEWCISSRLFRGIEIVTIEHRYQVINNVGRPLVAHAVLLPAAKKVTSDKLNRATLIPLPSDPNQATPIPAWDVPSSTAVVLDRESNASFSTQTSPVLFLAFQDKEGKQDILRWSRAVSITPEVIRQSVALSVDGQSTLPVVVTSHIDNGAVYVVVALDPVPRMLLENACPFTLQFGQAIPPQSPSHVGGSEKIVIVEQLQELGEVPEVDAYCSTHYELPVMREWFSTSSEVQRLPELHMQALYDVNVAQISEERGEQGEVANEVTTQVPQGWSKGFDLNFSGKTCVTLPGRGQVLIDVSQERLCTCVKIQPYEKLSVDSSSHQPISLPRSFISADLFICQFSMSVIDEVTNFRNPYEVLRLTAEGVSLTHSVGENSYDEDRVCPEVTLCIGAFQVDNQLQDDTYEFSVILVPNNTQLSPKKTPLPRRPTARFRVKPLVSVKCRYELSAGASDIFLKSLEISLQPVSLYLEDSFLYRVGGLLASFLPTLLHSTESTVTPLSTVLDVTQSTIHPFSLGELNITPVSLNVTLHASVKLFVSVDDSPLSLGHFHLSPVFLPFSALVQKLTYHYSTAALFKVGWVLGSLELLGNPAGLVRSFSQGVADFFYLPYDGLTRGPGAFVSGMSRGMSSFVRHLSTGTLTSITSLASSMARNLDRLSLDGEHLRILEEQRCRRPKKVLTGLSQGLGGFALSLLGAVAGIVDQPLQGIQRAGDVREAASGVITGVGKGLIGVVTKPLGGAMELVSQTGQGILQGAGLTQLPSRLFTPGDGLQHCARNSHLKYFWKMLHNQSETDLLLHLDATVVIPSGHDYEGVILLTRNTLFIVGSAVDAIQQTLLLHDIDLQEDDEDNRNVCIVNQSVITKEENDDGDAEIHGSGDSDRLRQFLRDARAQAMMQMSTRTISDSDLSCAAQKFVLTVDPMLRRILVLQFNAAKRNCAFQS